jgi:allantoinase
MPSDLIIRGGLIVRVDSAEIGDLVIDGGKIVEAGPSVSGVSRAEIDATGLTIFPGLIDSHVHFNEPGRTEWEGIASGSAALAAGGGTCFFDMPLNSSPPVLDAESFDLKLAAANAKSLTDFGLWGGLVPGNLDRLEELAERGVVGFKAFMSNSGIADFQSVDDLSLYRGMQKAKALGLLVAVHAESESITSALTAEMLAAGRTDIAAYLESRPVVAEAEAIERAILLAEETGCRLHIVHVSTPRGVELVHRAAARSGDVTCETCPHYLVLNRHDIERLGAAAKCAPPLRSLDINEGLWTAMSAGKIRIVASDHSPSPPGMKTSENFFKVWGGIAGVQSTLPILLSRVPQLPLPLVGRLIASNVADRFQIAGKGRIDVGMDADLVLVQPNQSFKLNRKDLLDRHKLSPYVGRTFHGVIKKTVVRGSVVFEDGRIVAENGGRLIKPAPR